MACVPACPSRVRYDRLIEAITTKLPKVAAHLDAARPDVLHGVEDELSHSGALEHDVWRQPGRRYGAVVVGSAYRCNKVGLHPRGHLVQDMDLQAPLCAEQCGEKADRAGTGYQHDTRLPFGSRADPEDMVPGFRHNGCRLQQDA